MSSNPSDLPEILNNLLSTVVPALVEQTNLSEITIQSDASGSFSLHLKRIPTFETPPALASHLNHLTHSARMSFKSGPHSFSCEKVHGGAPAALEPFSEVLAATGSAESDLCAIATKVTAPLVGILYIAKAPHEPPFCKVGDVVTKGQTLFIIDSMKVMNPVSAPISGKIVKIGALNESPVEFGEVLAYIA